MKLTATQLRQIIREETKKHLTEAVGMSRTSMAVRIKDWTGEDVSLDHIEAVVDAIMQDPEVWEAINAEYTSRRREREMTQ